MAKVFLGVGHGGSDPGAVGYIKEADVNLAMALACRDYLEARGVTVAMSRTRDENDPIGDEVRECNAFNPDLAVDIHNNAGGGKGFEAIHYSRGGLSKTLAANIEAEVKAIGQNSRGLKTRLDSNGNDYFAFIRSVKAPSVICEGVFVDNAADAALADTAEEQRAFGVAYAKGILKTLGIADGGTAPASYPSPSPAPASAPTQQASCYPRYTGASGSIADALRAIGVDWSYQNRAAIAQKNGISGYKGTAEQNVRMLALLKQGKLIR